MIKQQEEHILLVVYSNLLIAIAAIEENIITSKTAHKCKDNAHNLAIINFIATKEVAMA